MKNSLFLLLSSALLWTGCHSGIDYKDLPLDPKDVIDYGARVKNGEIGPGPTAYALIRQGFQSGGPKQLDQERVKIEEILKEMENLPFESTFNTSQKSKLDTTLIRIRDNLRDDIWPKMANASLAAETAVSLQKELEKNIKSGGVLVNELKTLESDIPVKVKPKYASASKKLVESYERIYQLATIYSQAIAQKKANVSLSHLKKALEQLKNWRRQRLFSLNGLRIMMAECRSWQL